jgi:hypothetical protein
MFQVFQSYKFQSSLSLFLVFLLISNILLLFFSFHILLQPSQQLITEKELICFILMANNHFTLNESFCFHLTVLIFLLALSSSFHPKILTKFYSIYFKVPHKILDQSDGRI